MLYQLSYASRQQASPVTLIPFLLNGTIIEVTIAVPRVQGEPCGSDIPVRPAFCTTRNSGNHGQFACARCTAHEIVSGTTFCPGWEIVPGQRLHRGKEVGATVCIRTRLQTCRKNRTLGKAASAAGLDEPPQGLKPSRILLRAGTSEDEP